MLLDRSVPLSFKRAQVHSGIQGLSELDKEELPNYISLLPNRASLFLQLVKTSKIMLFLFTSAHNYAAERTTLPNLLLLFKSHTQRKSQLSIACLQKLLPLSSWHPLPEPLIPVLIHQ